MATTTRSRRPLTEGETRQRREAQRERLEALHERFTAQVAELTEGDQWRAMLEVAARFHRYSFRNVLLIHAQRPDATRVAGYRTWQALGRQVRRGERGIQILAPVTYGVRGDEQRGEATAETDDRRRQLRGFTVEHVWDVSQTDGEPLPDVRPVLLEGQGVSRLWEATGERVRAAGYELKRGRCTNAAANGETDPKTRTVTVRSDLSDRQALKTQLHELAHIELGHVDDVVSYVLCRGRCEVEAESVAYLVCAEAGINAGDYSLPYVARWADGDVRVVEETAERVLTVARDIVHAVLVQPAA